MICLKLSRNYGDKFFLFDLLAPIYDRVIGSRDPEDFHDMLDLPAGGGAIGCWRRNGAGFLWLAEHGGLFSDL